MGSSDPAEAETETEFVWEPGAVSPEPPRRPTRLPWRRALLSGGVAVLLVVGLVAALVTVGHDSRDDTAGRAAGKGSQADTADHAAAPVEREPATSPSSSPTLQRRLSQPGDQPAHRQEQVKRPPKPTKTYRALRHDDVIGKTGVLTGPGDFHQCIDVDTNTDKSGNKVQLWTCNGVPGQQWTFEPDGTIRSFGKCLDTVSQSTADRAKLQLWDCNGAATQKWLKRSDGSIYHQGSHRCLDDPDGHSDSGTQLQIWDCNGLSPQKWQFLQ